MFRKLAEKHLLLPASPGKEFVTGEGFDYLGRHYRLQLTDDPPGTACQTRTRPSAHAPRPGRCWRRSGSAMIALVPPARAHAWLPRRIRPWAERMGLHPGDLDVRDLGYRWGSLGKDDRLNIHWAAMQLPVSLLDYVIVHELAHIGQPRHTPAFWATVERALPDYDQRRTRLATTGTTLWLGRGVPGAGMVAGTRPSSVPLCPFSTFLVSDLDRPFCHP